MDTRFDAIYADFTSPLALLASQRLDRLGAVGLPTPDWRAVSFRPTMPEIGIPLDSRALANRQEELDRLRDHLLPGEVLPEQAPGLLPHPGSATAVYAEAYLAGVADEVRGLLLRAYWMEGQDIGQPEVLRRLVPPAFAKGRRTFDPIQDWGYAVSPQRSPVTTGAYRLVHRWQQEWLALGTPVGLTVDGPGGSPTGVAALSSLDALAAVAP